MKRSTNSAVGFFLKYMKYLNWLGNVNHSKMFYRICLMRFRLWLGIILKD